jgi:biotin carboxyl carrier protein
MIFTYQHGSQTYTVDIQPQPDGQLQAVIDGRTYQVEARQQTDGGWRLLIDGSPITAYTAARDQQRFVKIGSGPALSVTVPDARARRRAASAGAQGQLVAQMPGQVVDVLVKPGDRVQSGQMLAVLEAMKMEIRVTAPQAGTIRQVLVSKGDVVERDQNLIELDSDEADASS